MVLNIALSCTSGFCRAAAASEVNVAGSDMLDLAHPVRGVSVQAHVGGGYMVLGRNIPASSTFPQLGGRSEMLGAGPALDVALALDVLPFMAVQLAGGVTYAGARRNDYVHSLSQVYGAIGLRLMMPLAERWLGHLTPALGYFRQDNEVDPSASGIGVLLAAGVEYFVHVRHFSLGADLSIQAPLAPTRLFVGIMPHVRYTF